MCYLTQYSVEIFSNMLTSGCSGVDFWIISTILWHNSHWGDVEKEGKMKKITKMIFMIIEIRIIITYEINMVYQNSGIDINLKIIHFFIVKRKCIFTLFLQFILKNHNQYFM